ncbi:hypothetical protein ABID23_001573 [Bartonella silvatica]|uniref:Uncharacterized protein n=1 Tax=Bartonella silvatica TaxID=357760 RepID=A0ABV2HJB6_9HYPH
MHYNKKIMREPYDIQGSHTISTMRNDLYQSMCCKIHLPYNYAFMRQILPRL